MTDQMPTVDSSGSATAELFRLRRSRTVDTIGFLGFIAAFAVACIVAFRRLTSDFDVNADKAMLRYIATILLSGMAGGLVGMGCGHLVATAWERVDLWRHPRRYEAGPGVN